MYIIMHIVPINIIGPTMIDMGYDLKMVGFWEYMLDLLWKYFDIWITIIFYMLQLLIW